MSAGRRAVVSWSGGKDSALALHRARARGLDVKALFTMLSPGSGTSRSHGLPPGLLEEQAGALGVPLHVAHADWDDYEREFKGGLAGLVAAGIEVAVFGDIFLDDHKDWVERVCREVGCEAIEPLWGEPTGELVRHGLGAGIRARVCTLRPELVDASHLGALLDLTLVEELERSGVDPCGEYGEYHTVVLESPDFGRRLVIDRAERRTGADHAHWNIGAWHSVENADAGG